MFVETLQLVRQIRAIMRSAERIDRAWDEEGAIYPGHVDTLHRLVMELYALTGRTPPGGDA